jgi:xylan 1,4-beta-xylosidase
LCANVPAGAETVLIKVDANAPGKTIRHVWSFFGFDECNFAYTENGKELMKILSTSNRAPAYLRCHFLLNTGDGKAAMKWGSTNVYTEDANGQPIYDWKIIDKIMDSVTESGCRPLVEIGFMPEAMSIKPQPYQHKYPPDTWAGWAYPPKDYDKWAQLIRKWALHSKEKYGSDAEDKWLWELWNEPDIFYWQGTFEEYCKLFDYTEKALHDCLPDAILGGPHTTSPTYRRPAKYLRDFLTHCSQGKNYAADKRGTRLDYIGFHSKGNTSLVDGHPRMDLGANLKNNRQGFEIISEFEQYRNTPIIIGECDPEGLAALSSTVHPANDYRNGSYYAVYEVAIMKHTIDLAEQTGVNLKGVLTWAFMFEGKDYFDGFRTLSTNGIGKPVLNGFMMLGRLEGKRVPLSSSGALGAERIISEKVLKSPDIDGLASASENKVQVVLWNYHDDIIDAEPNEVQLDIKLPSDITKVSVTHYRIDKTHSNSYTKWLSLGSPQKPTEEQLAALKKTAELEMLEPAKNYNVDKGILSLTFNLPRHSVSLVEAGFVK